MLFNSFEFLFFFLPITFIGFFWLSKKVNKTTAISWLVVASLVFYSWWNPAYLPLILFSMFFNYGVGVVLGKDYSQTLRKSVLAAGVICNLALIGYYKYAFFFIDQMNVVAGTSFNFQKVMLPLAISFFTFQQIAYLVDAYRQETKKYNFLNYSLFVTFFPQLIAGPIVHHSETLSQFHRTKIYKFDYRNMAIGLTIFSIGLFKKCIFADGVADIANAVFSFGGDHTFFDAWLGAVSYSLQLYFDFSGYSDMAIGIAYMFGIKIPKNFNSPYKATGIIDFWRRWHITLSRFLRDYLYFPLGGSRKGAMRKYTNLFLTMLLGGIWHGAGWTFIVWGALHGTYLIFNHAWRNFKQSVFKIKGNLFWGEKILAHIVTLLALTIGWVYFRAETMDKAHEILHAMFMFDTLLLPVELEGLLGKIPHIEDLGVRFIDIVAVDGLYLKYKIPFIAALICIAIFAPNSGNILDKLESIGTKDAISRWERALISTLPYVVVLMLVVCVSTFLSVSQFLYFNF